MEDGGDGWLWGGLKQSKDWNGGVREISSLLLSPPELLRYLHQGGGKSNICNNIYKKRKIFNLFCRWRIVIALS